MQEPLILIGDFNKHIGAGELGIKGNHPKVTHGGHLIRSFLENADYICVNNTDKAVGGPFTRFDPSDPKNENKMSCLDIAVISRQLLPYLNYLKIDSEQIFAPSRPISKTKSVFPDHYPLILEFHNLPREKQKQQSDSYTIWNTNREGGWEKFRELTNNAEEFVEILENENVSATELMNNIEKKLNKIKFKAFGKVRRQPSLPDKELRKLVALKEKVYSEPTVKRSEVEKVESDLNKKLIELQREDLEKEVKTIKATIAQKGRAAAMFKLFESVNGPKKLGQDPVAMIDPKSNKLVFDPSEIKKISLEYCYNLLQKSTANPGFENEIFVQDMLHLARNETNEDFDDSGDITVNDMKSRMKKLAKKGPEKYRFLLKSGNSFKEVIFELCKKVWMEESKPQQWRNTVIIQLYKGKGPKEEFNNQRNIHTKEEIPKLFEGIVVDKSKEKIVSFCSKFQIGGIPGHRSAEHLFSIKSVISYYILLGIPLLLQLFDISKYFDKESLRDTMDTLYMAGIHGKLYRLWFELNRDTQIRVKTGVGMSGIKPTGENVAQGSIGGALASSANLDKTLRMYFEGSDCEVSYDDIRLEPITFQDDAARFVTDIVSAQKGNDFVSSAMNLKQLTINVDKCATILFGKKKVVKKTLDEIDNMGGLKINNIKVLVKENEKYLGDYICSAGMAKSVEKTIEKRYGRIIKGIIEIKTVVEDFRANLLGGLDLGLQIWETALLPSLLHNSDTWFSMCKTSVQSLENLQNSLLRNLFAVPSSAPISVLHWDSGSLTMENRILKSKMLFLKHLVELGDEALAKQIFNKQKEKNMVGPLRELVEIMNMLKLPNIVEKKEILSNKQWKSRVKQVIWKKNENELKSRLKEYSKLKGEDILEEDFEKKDYIKSMVLQDSRKMIRIRSKTTRAKMNMKSNENFSRDLWRCDDCGNLDTQSHILWCPVYAQLREGKDINVEKDMVTYFREVFRARENSN